MKLYLDALAIDPGVPDAWYNVGYLRHWAGDFEGALTAYEELVRAAAFPGRSRCT